MAVAANITVPTICFRKLSIVVVLSVSASNVGKIFNKCSDYSELRLRLSYNYGCEIPGFKQIFVDYTVSPDDKFQLCLYADKLELSNLVNDWGVWLQELFLDLVPIQSEDDAASHSQHGDKLLERTDDGLPKSLEASSTESPKCLALGMFWLQKCVQRHTTCDRPASISSEDVRPSRLIDVGAAEEGRLKLCLQADFPAKLQYATLSHCWGVVQDKVNLTQTNLGAWQTIIPNEALLPTFKDAIKVTRSLGMQYLWIDSLCIIQDSKRDWLSESTRMSNVYEYAHCNIAATASEGDALGIFKTRDPAIDLPVPLNLADVTDGENNSCLRGVYNIHLNRSWLYEMELDAPLAKRAWVVQEVRGELTGLTARAKIVCSGSLRPGSSISRRPRYTGNVTNFEPANRGQKACRKRK